MSVLRAGRAGGGAVLTVLTVVLAVAVRLAVMVSVAVTLRAPAVRNVTVKFFVPASPATNV